MYKYKTVKELVTMRDFGYCSTTLSSYLKRPEFNKFRKEVGTRKMLYLFCPDFTRAWNDFAERLDEGKAMRHKYSMQRRSAVKGIE